MVSIRTSQSTGPCQTAGASAIHYARWPTCDALGKLENDEAFEEYRLDPGNVRERRWELLNWQRPADETSPCWWLANPAAAKAADEEDQDSPVKLVCRSLQVLRQELRATRCATSLKLRQRPFS